MARSIQGPRPYDRQQAMGWLDARYSWAGFTGPNFQDETPAGRGAVIEWLRRRCRTMRAAGIAGAHHYSLPCHREHFRILKAEQAALSGTESLPTIPDRRRGGPPSARINDPRQRCEDGGDLTFNTERTYAEG